MYKIISTNPRDHRIKWKKGDIVICKNNAGFSTALTEGKEYEILKSFREYKANQVTVIDDNGTQRDLFSTRFTTIKLERREKLKKIKKIKNF